MIPHVVWSAVPPRAAADAGYKNLVFSDNFDKLDVSRDGRGKHKWYAGLWYKSVPPVNNIQQHDGFVRLRSLDGSRRGLGAELHTMARTPYGTSTTFHFGYFEARIRSSQDLSNFGSFWLESSDHILDSDKGNWRRYCEVDIAEFGAATDGYAASAIDWIDKKSHQLPYPPVKHLPFGANLNNWNVYGLLWEPGHISFYFNNKMIRSIVAPPPCDEQRLFLILSGAKNGGAKPQSIDVDWVHVFR